MTATVTPTGKWGAAPTLSTREHEARHVVASWCFDCPRAEFVHVGVHSFEEGHVRFDPRSDIGLGSLIVSIVGWLGDPNLPEDAAWPEPWPVRRDAPEALGILVDHLGLSRDQYEQACGIAERLVADPEFKAAVNLVARALMVAPSIDAAGLEILREQTAYADEPEVVIA